MQKRHSCDTSWMGRAVGPRPRIGVCGLIDSTKAGKTEGQQDSCQVPSQGQALPWTVTVTYVTSQETQTQVGAGLPPAPNTIPMENEREMATPSEKLRPCVLCFHKPEGHDIPISQMRKLNHRVIHPFSKIPEHSLCARAYSGH